MFEQEEKKLNPKDKLAMPTQLGQTSSSLVLGFLPRLLAKKLVIILGILIVLGLLGWAASSVSFKKKPVANNSNSTTNEADALDIQNNGALPNNQDLADQGNGNHNLDGTDIEYLSFFDFYRYPEQNYDFVVQDYSLPLNTKVDVINYYEMSRKINLDTAIDNLNNQGFSILDNPSGDEYGDFYAMYSWLADKDVPIVITTDFMMYYYQQNLKKIFKDIEENIFYDNLWDINKELYDKAKLRYENHLRDIGNVNDPILEGERLSLAYLGVALELLQPSTEQINYNLDINDQTKFTDLEAARFNFSLPYYLKDDVLNEVALIREHKAVTKSPVLLYQRSYGDFVVPKEYQENARLNNFYLTGKWLNSVFPLFYLGDACPDCLLDQDDWRINMIAAQLLVKDFASSDSIKTKWARIYKVMAFFKGLRQDLTYVNYRDAAVDAFGTGYDISYLFSSDNPDREANFEKLQQAILQYNYPAIKGGYDINNSKFNSYQGLKVLADFYWPNDYIFTNLTTPQVGAYTLNYDDKPFTGCDINHVTSRCLGYSLDVINLFHAPKTNYNDWQINSSFENYNFRSQELRSQLNEQAWQENNYWSNLNILNSLFEASNNDLPIFAKQSVWEDRRLNTAVASWVNLQLPADKLGLFSLYNQEHSGSLDNVGKVNYYNYVEPNVYFMQNMINTTQMLQDTLSALRVTDGVSSVGLILKEMKQDLEMLKDISVEQITGAEVSDQEYQFISDFSHRYLVLEPGVKEIALFNGADKKSLKERIDGVNLLVLIRNYQGQPVLVAGPIFQYSEYK